MQSITIGVRTSTPCRPCWRVSTPVISSTGLTGPLLAGTPVAPHPALIPTAATNAPGGPAEAPESAVQLAAKLVLPDSATSVLIDEPVSLAKFDSSRSFVHLAPPYFRQALINHDFQANQPVGELVTRCEQTGRNWRARLHPGVKLNAGSAVNASIEGSSWRGRLRPAVGHGRS
jgi:hypothetical protein